MADDVVACEFGTAVDSADAFEHALLDVLGEAFAVGAVVEGFEAADLLFPGVVVVDADEDGAFVAVGGADALGEGDEVVAAAGHDRAEAHGFEVGFEADGGVEGEVFFVDATPLAAFVVAAVAGVDDDGAETGLGGGAENEESAESEELDEVFHGVQEIGNITEI